MSDTSEDGEVETLLDHGRSYSNVTALAMGLQLCTMEHLCDHPQSRLVKVIQELVTSDLEMQRKVESTLASIVLRENMIKQLDKMEKLDTAHAEEVYTSGWLSGYISHLPVTTKDQLEKAMVYLTEHRCGSGYGEWESEFGVG